MVSGVRKKQPAQGTFRALVILFVVSLVFEGMVNWKSLIPIPPSTIVGFTTAILFIFTRALRLRLETKAVRAFTGFLVITFILEIVRYQVGALPRYSEISSFRAYMQFAQVLVYFILLQDLLSDHVLQKRLVTTFLACTLLMAVLGILGFMNRIVYAKTGRIGISGLNLNTQGFLYAIAISGIAVYILEEGRRITPKVVGLMIAAGVLAIAIFRTGSRSAAIALFVGLTIILIMNTIKGKFSVLFTIFPILIGIVGSAALLGREIVEQRMELVIEEGDTGGRIELSRSGWDFFRKAPIIGIGASYVNDLAEEVYGRSERRISVHNTYLQVMISFGIFGALPWIIGLFYTISSAWRNRRQWWGEMITVLIISSMIHAIAANHAYDKFFWILIALATRPEAVTMRESGQIEHARLGKVTKRDAFVREAPALQV